MNFDWESISGFDGWAETLDTMLKDADAAVRAQDLHGKLSVQRTLRTFIKKSDDRVAEGLDKIAMTAINNIAIATLDEALAALALRSSELEEHTRVVKAVAVEAQNNARSIRLSRFQNALDSVTNTISSLKSLQTHLESGSGDSRLAADIADLLGKLEGVKQALQV